MYSKYVDIAKPDMATKLLSVGIYLPGFFLLWVTGIFSPNIWREIDIISAPVLAVLGYVLVHISLKIWTSEKPNWKLMAALVIVPWTFGVMYFYHHYDSNPTGSNIPIELELPEIKIKVAPDDEGN